METEQHIRLLTPLPANPALNTPPARFHLPKYKIKVKKKIGKHSLISFFGTRSFSPSDNAQLSSPPKHAHTLITNTLKKPKFMKIKVLGSFVWDEDRKSFPFRCLCRFKPRNRESQDTVLPCTAASGCLRRSPRSWWI